MFKYRQILGKIEPFVQAKEAILITGMRRTGKTTLLQYYFERCPGSNKLYLDLENVLNRRYFDEANYERIKHTFEFLGLDFSLPAYVFLDEIQFAPQLPSIVKYFIDHYQVKFFLTGSSSFYLKNLFSESLAGRKVVFELFPLTFQEFLHFKELPFHLPPNVTEITEAMHETIDPYYDEYLKYGGFPGVVLKSKIEEKEKALEDIFTSYFQLEVLQLGDFRRNETIRDLILLLLEQTGSKLDTQKMCQDLRISRATLYQYLSFLEGTYFIKTIRPYSKGRSVEIRKTPKVYLCDVGLVNRFARLDTGRLFEQSVFQNLRVKGELHYFQKKSGIEIDFILNKEKAFEVKLSVQGSDVSRLERLSHEIGLREYEVVCKTFTPLKEHVTYGYCL